jgi:hypothetical protein
MDRDGILTTVQAKAKDCLLVSVDRAFDIICVERIW